MYYKEDWEETKEIFKLWWENKDRPLIAVTAPREPVAEIKVPNIHNLTQRWTNPEFVINYYEYQFARTYFAGAAYPNLWINLGPGIMATYLGAIPKFAEDTVWFETPKSWEEILKTKFEPQNKWWQITKELTAEAVRRSDDKYFVGITDLGGITDILAALRGTQNLLLDLIQHPQEVKAASLLLVDLWFEYYEGIHQIVQSKMCGSSAWMGLWSPGKWYPIQCDFSYMISPKMFEEFAIPHLQIQCQRLDHTIYHWDGSGQIPHLDLLLDIPELDGIQWTPGAGNPSTGSPQWYPLYKKIQRKGKLPVILGVEPEQIAPLFNELSPEVYISTWVSSQQEAEETIKRFR